jgi:endo-1,3-1,4-beta-glycanase ExoK
MLGSVSQLGKPSFVRHFVAATLLMLGAAGAAHAVGGTFFSSLDSHDTTLWGKSDGWTNGSPFNVGWRGDHITFSGGFMTLTLDNATCTAGCSGMPYASGEYRSNDVYGYGKYETRMKVASGSGLVTSFFIYNGSPWDEIDVEILGKSPTQLQTNYFTNGVGGHETVINLGFDASAGYHNYAIVWAAGSIKWYVDNVLIHTETGGRGPLPTHAGKIMANVWTATPGTGTETWLGVFSYGGPVTAKYDWIQYFLP